MTDKTRAMTEIVAKYLRKYPDFLVKHPEVLQAVRLPHESGAAVSLIERQVEQLRDQNRSLTRQLNQLVRVATDNEHLMSRLHHLTLELMVISDLSQFFERLSQALMSEFNADILNISLFDHQVECSKDIPVFTVHRDDHEVQLFQSNLDRGETTCGRLSRAKLEFLFSSRAQWVQSTAFVPLGSDGFLAIGSSDPARFYPGMGTLFLDLLARVITSRVALTEPQAIRRSA